MMPAPFGWHIFFTDWHFSPVWNAVILLALLAYGAGVARARRRGERSVHPVRIASFCAALLVLAVTVNSAIDGYSMMLFWDHMIEHLLLIMVVPALLVTGHPLTVLVQATTGRTRERVLAVLRSRPVSVVTHPVVALGIYSIVIVGTHLTSFMNAMTMHMWLMPVEQVVYLVSGSLLLVTLLAEEPLRWRPPYLMRFAVLMLAMIPDTLVGIVLMQSSAAMFPGMTTSADWAPTPLRDEVIAGGIMWAGGDGLMMLFAVIIMLVWISSPNRDATAGAWLEKIRRQRFTDIAGGAEALGASSEESDVDEDEAYLDAYNRMLKRLNAHQ
jgi:putative copper resistance protein D